MRFINNIDLFPKASSKWKEHGLYCLENATQIKSNCYLLCSWEINQKVYSSGVQCNVLNCFFGGCRDLFSMAAFARKRLCLWETVIDSSSKHSVNRLTPSPHVAFRQPTHSAPEFMAHTFCKLSVLTTQARRQQHSLEPRTPGRSS